MFSSLFYLKFIYVFKAEPNFMFFSKKFWLIISIKFTKQTVIYPPVLKCLLFIYTKFPDIYEPILDSLLYSGLFVNSCATLFELL